MKLTVYCILAVIISLGIVGCNSRKSGKAESLSEILKEVTDSMNVRIGIAVISSTGDTIALNDSEKFAMMSVVKLHQSLSAANIAELDSVIHVSRHELDINTYTPMLKEYPAEGFDISVAELIRWALCESDNNASNILFNRICSPDLTQTFIENIVEGDDFGISCRESDIQADHGRTFDNWSSPLAVAKVVDAVYTKPLIDTVKQDFIREQLHDCHTGAGCIIKGLGNVKYFGHKTGSGFKNDKGEIMARNDAGYIVLDNGVHYTLVVMIKNYPGSEEEADQKIAEISKIVYEFYASDKIPI